MKRCHNVDGTPNNRPSSPTTFRTPVNARPSTLWSPIFHAITPDLNAATPVDGGKTPALLKSLGIQQELDVSWTNAMATPTTSSDMSSHAAVAGIVALQTPESKEEKSSKTLQRRHLFHSDSPTVMNSETNSETKNTRVAEELARHTHVGSPSQPDINNVAVPVKKETGTQSLLSLLNRPPSKFIYPKPIYIQIKPSGNQQMQAKKEDTTNTTESTSLVLNDLSENCVESSRYLKKKNSKEICKSLKFEEPSMDSSSSSSSNNIHEPMDYICSDPSFNQQQDIVSHNATWSKQLNPSLPEVPRTIIGFTNDKGMKLDVSKEALAQAGGIFDQADLAIAKDFAVSKEMSTPLCIQTPKQGMGFSTASGKHFTISKQAMLQAQAMFDQVSASDLDNPEETNKVLKKSTLNVSASKTPIPCKIETRPSTVDYETPKTSFTGFNMASGKNVSISRKAMVRAQALFDKVSDDVTSSPNLEEPSNVKSPQLPIKKETPSSLNCATPKAPFTGFNMASGKNVQISKQSLSRAQALFENIDTEASSTSSETANEPALSLNFNIPAAAATGFSTASGKNFNLSKEAMARAQAIFQTVDEDASLPCPLKTSSEEAKFTPKISALAFKRHKLENETPKASYTMGAKKLLVSESSIPGGRKLFEKAVKMEVDTQKGAINQGLGDSSSDLPTLPLAHPLLNTPPRSQSKDLLKTEHQDDSGEDWVSSPTIGKKKTKSKVPDPETPSSFYDTPTIVSAVVLVRRVKAREAQKTTIESKRNKTVKVSPKPGSLYLKKTDSSLAKKTWKETAGVSTLPDDYLPFQLVNDYGILPSVYLVRSTNASLFSFYAWEHFPNENFSNNSSGFPFGEFLVILSDDNTIGIEEIATSLLASKNVDPKLVDVEWIRNHYRWIVWKLASMELRIPTVFARQCLTLPNVLEQLKYRYDLEIDRCQRSALKRIIEQDDTPAKTMILCVADIRTRESDKGSTQVMELTDGWYSIDAPCDIAMTRMIENGKVFVGIKLAISGAELASPGPTTPLEKGSDTFLKISTNSIRRARWDAKLGVFKQPKPFPVALASILPDGGCVSYTQVTIVRVYPMIYVEKSSQGKSVFHNERHYRRISENSAVRRERMMEKLLEDIEREEDEQERKRKKFDSRQEFNLTDEEKRSKIVAEARKRMDESVSNMKGNEGIPLLKLRVIDSKSSSSKSAIVSIWNANEEMQQYLKEKRSYGLYSIKADGLRAGDLQLTTIRNQTRWEELENTSPLFAELERSVISFEAANKPGFLPLYNELDAVGLVVFVGPEQSKGPFQIAVLSNGTHFLGLKCWSKFEDYALSDIIVPGNFLAFSNLQWRPSANKQASNFPFAFIYEGTLVLSRPSSKHLDTALTALKQTISDPIECVTESESHLSNLLINGNVTPSAISRIGSGIRRESGSHTPTTFASNESKTPASSGNPIANRARLLEQYGTPPALAPLTVTATPLVRQKFKPPARIKPSI